MGHQLIINICGWIATFGLILGYLPQAIQTIITRNTDGISLPGFISSPRGQKLWQTKKLLVFLRKRISLLHSTMRRFKGMSLCTRVTHITKTLFPSTTHRQFFINRVGNFLAHAFGFIALGTASGMSLLCHGLTGVLGGFPMASQFLAFPNGTGV